MKHAITILNLAGVLGLGVLCAAQWHQDRRSNAEISRLEGIRAEQSQRLGEQARTISGHVADLAALREHLTRLADELKAAEGRWQGAERELAQLSAEREQLRDAVKNWSAAVDARDEKIRAGNARIQELAVRLNDTVHKFNELATNYNTSVGLLDERTAAYNELVSRFNELAKK